VIQAWNPITTFYNPSDPGNLWTSTVVTETVLTRYVTYMGNTTIETILTETQTVNQTKTVIGTANETITHQTPTFEIEATPGVFITVDAGPTYVVYNNISGGLKYHTRSSGPNRDYTLDLCRPSITALENWQPAETATEDWGYFISTHTGTEELYSSPTNNPYPLPSKLIEFLKQDPDVQTQFQGVDIATCTPDITYGSLTHAKSSAAARPSRTPAEPPQAPPFFSRTIGTFISTTYESTSVHVTVRGCLRCDNTEPLLEPTPTKVSNKNVESIASFTHISDQPIQSNTRPNQPDKPAENMAKPTQSKPNTAPGIPSVIETFIQTPSIWTRQTPVVTVTNSVTIGGVAVPINTARPTQGNPNGPNGHNQDDQNTNPLVIIGSETLTPGQTKTINGVPVVVSTDGGGTKIVVDGSTVAYNPSAPTGGPVLTVGGGGTITANPQGEFVFGTETLRPGGPAVTVVGNTISLSPSGVAIINGVTHTLANAPAPTAAPVLTVGGQAVSATVVGGSTVLVVAPGHTLTPGGLLVVDGKTFSMPADSQGSTIVINGQTSTFGAGQLALTLANGNPVSATILGGSTVFVIAPGQTLTSGGSLVVDGTTYSMLANGHGSTIIVNGQTSALSTGQSILTLDSGKAITAQTVDGSTAYILAPGQTLTPGGMLTISGTTYSMPSASIVVVNGVTSTLSANYASITSAPALTLEGITYTYTVRDGTTEYVLGEGATLVPGSAVVVEGTTYSLDASGTALIVNGQTSTVGGVPKSASAATTTTTGSVDTNGRNVVSSVGEPSRAGGAQAYRGGVDKWVESVVVVVAGWALMLL
jgi:hypothetical protein